MTITWEDLDVEDYREVIDEIMVYTESYSELGPQTDAGPNVYRIVTIPIWEEFTGKIDLRPGNTATFRIRLKEEYSFD